MHKLMIMTGEWLDWGAQVNLKKHTVIQYYYSLHITSIHTHTRIHTHTHTRCVHCVTFSSLTTQYSTVQYSWGTVISSLSQYCGTEAVQLASGYSPWPTPQRKSILGQAQPRERSHRSDLFAYTLISQAPAPTCTCTCTYTLDLFTWV